ncbi:dolichol monophosphate mannose synthase [Alicyclobacillus contaminans]|uniref:glycosyltransferase n=1 Tax=Alicyclobacillus contaminans TaxID=392016 RepID=UPI0003FE2452|nr:glycosyltransferase family 2 protein [Alicyclobacillus contaminans]GMA51078.1 dolichol monophosphate mannose synthase [Alicyclobacillus contaminans]
MELSIVIPTFNEKENVRAIVRRIEQALASVPCEYEIWFIDDSRDDTPDALAALAADNARVHFVHREHERGLGTAVVEGFRRSRGRFIVVMDADLQHPPELLPTILQRLRDGIDVVIPSRFVPGGSDGGLNAFRKLVSWTARKIGQLAIRRLRSISDCTGGYFGLHREVIRDARLNPIGWKILMEVLVHGHYETVHEIPYAFQARDAGESKMSLREQWNYLKHIGRLLWSSPEDRRFYVFCMVGALGVVVNLVMMSICLYLLHIRTVAWASILSSCVAMIHNFLWNDRVTWGKQHAHPVKWRRALQMPTFILVSSVGIAITALVAHVFHLLHWHALVGQCLGIIIATAWSFTANNRFTWGTQSDNREQVKRTIRVTHE